MSIERTRHRKRERARGGLMNDQRINRRVLVTWGSKRGGTEGIAHIVGEELVKHGLDVVCKPAREVRSVEGFDAVIVGGALYAFRWTSEARRFVTRHVAALRRVPVWFFSSGPLDDSADRESLAATLGVAVLAERVGARGHVTFGGRLAPDSKGFPASAMAKDKSGDWRNPERIRAWTAALATAIPSATPGPAVDHPARSIPRLVAHGIAAWAACAAALWSLSLASSTLGLVVHALLVPVVFALVARRYFHARGARDALPVALAFTGMAAALDLVVAAGAVQRSLDIFASVSATWLPYALAFATTWITGSVMSVMPPKRAENPSARVPERGSAEREPPFAPPRRRPT
jgi:menaquinone-dependent protoporphyrinogen oxidase